MGRLGVATLGGLGLLRGGRLGRRRGRRVGDQRVAALGDLLGARGAVAVGVLAAVRGAVAVGVGHGWVAAHRELRGVGEAVAVAVERRVGLPGARLAVHGIEVQCHLLGVGEAVAVAVDLAVRHAVAVGVRDGGVGADIDLDRVGDAVAVGVVGRIGDRVAGRAAALGIERQVLL